MKFESPFGYLDKVHIDGDESITATVLAFAFRETRPPIVECSWVHAGAVQTHWIEETRLTKKDDHR